MNVLMSFKNVTIWKNQYFRRTDIYELTLINQINQKNAWSVIIGIL